MRRMAPRKPTDPLRRLALGLVVGTGLLLGLAVPASADFAYQAYTGTWSVLPNFTALTPVASGTTPTITLALATQADSFGLVFTNTLNAPTAGTYQFFTESNDGSRLYVDGTLVVDNDGLHGLRIRHGSIPLSAGSHTLRVEFFDRVGPEVLSVGYRTGNPAYQSIPADGQLAYTAPDESQYGSWGPLIAWPEIAISLAILEDGRVLSWSSTEIDAFPANATFTHSSIYDPATGVFTPVDNNFHDMFCAGVGTFENGTIIAAGGNPSDRRTSLFNPATNQWSPLPNMIDLRWYGTSATLPDNTFFTTFARDASNRSEVYNPVTNTWAARPNANMQTLQAEQNQINSAPNPTGSLVLEWLAHLAVTPQGDVFQGGPTPTWHRFDPMGGAPNVVLGQPIGNVARSFGNAVTYGEGKVLLIGGADPRANPPTSVNHVYRVDLNGPAPVVTPGAPMAHPRALSNTVTLANGELIVIGGNTVALQFDDTGSVYPVEIYNPTSNSWRTVESIDIPRNYHATAVLLKDGRVLSAGGGGCGFNCPANHLDGQIYSPPYLFEANDSPAIRPTLSVPTGTQIRAGDELVVTASATTTAFSVVRLSATTHHLNTDQRYLPIPAVSNGNGTFTLSFPSNPNTLIVGPYFLFALDADGTPSIGETIRVIRDVQSVPQPSAVYLSDIPFTTVANEVGPVERDRANGGVAAGDGGPLRLNGITYPKGLGVHGYSEISVALNQGYERFLSHIGLDDVRNGQCGEIQFEIRLDGVLAYTSGNFIDTTATGTIDLAVGNANTLNLRVLTVGNTCGDQADWAEARLIPKPEPGYRYYRFRPTKLRDDGTTGGVQLAELALFEDGLRRQAVVVTNPGGNNPPGQGPASADDANTATKWRDFNRGVLIYDFGVNVEIDAYQITTADDAPERDPLRWTLEASINGVDWDILDDRNGADQPTPVARLTPTAMLPIAPLDVVTPLPSAPRHSSTLIVETSTGADRIWNVNPDNDTVTASSAAGVVLAEIPVGDRPWSLARRPGQQRIYVTNKGSASITVLNSATHALDRTIALPRGSEPHGIVFSSDGSHYYVVLEATAIVQKRQASDDALVGSLALTGRPRHISIRNDDSRLLVSNFITPAIPGESTLTVTVAAGAAQVFSVNPTNMTLAGTHALPHDGRPQSESQGPGMPNYLGPAVVDFAGQNAYVPSKKDNVRSGSLRGIAGMTFESTVRANTSRIVLATGLEDPAFRVDHDNASVATGAALSGDDRYLFVTLETSRQLAVYDTTLGTQLMRLPTGRAPQSVALSSDGSRAYIHNFMDRTISRFDLTQMLQTHLPATNELAAIDVVATETLSPTVLLGKQHFYDAADDRLSLDNYMSCASCHNEGDSDGRSWDLGAFGEGVRNTVDLRGKGTGHGLAHWTGNFDEIQDFEGQIRALNLGQGLLTPAQFAATSNPLGAPKAGLSTDLDALAAYVASLSGAPASPHRPSAGSMSTAAQSGRTAFAAQGCLGCHAMPQLTDSPSGARHDIGTIDAASGQRLGAPLDGFDAPGLLGVWQSPPYLHDGSAATIEIAITSHAAFAGLAPATVSDIVSFLREAESGDLGPLLDDDGDGTPNLTDPAPLDPCIPNAFVPVCGRDSDGDGDTDFEEGATTDSDGDGIFDYLESSITDSDGDGVPDQSDSSNGNPCIPNPSACTPQVPTALPLGQLAILALALATGANALRRRARS
jgi:YVTN family beta-propeller protein